MMRECDIKKDTQTHLTLRWRNNQFILWSKEKRKLKMATLLFAEICHLMSFMLLLSCKLLLFSFTVFNGTFDDEKIGMTAILYHVASIFQWNQKDCNGICLIVLSSLYGYILLNIFQCNFRIGLALCIILAHAL